jgi:hypothetical protein
VRGLVALAGLVLALAACGGETETVTVERTVTQQETVTETTTETVAEPSEPSAAPGLPPRVSETYAELRAAAASGDYEQLRPLIPDQFSYSFGAPEGDAIDYWTNVVEPSGERPIEILTRLLDMPYTLYRGTYIWPFAYDKQPEELTGYERRILGDFADDFGAGSGYLGWRAGIERDGRWSFFIAGD